MLDPCPHENALQPRQTFLGEPEGAHRQPHLPCRTAGFFRERQIQVPDAPEFPQEDIHSLWADTLDLRQPPLDRFGRRRAGTDPSQSVPRESLGQREKPIRGAEIVPHVAACVKDRDKTLPAALHNGFGSRDAFVQEQADRPSRDVHRDGFCEEDRRDQPGEPIPFLLDAQAEHLGVRRLRQSCSMRALCEAGFLRRNRIPETTTLSRAHKGFRARTSRHGSAVTTFALAADRVSAQVQQPLPRATVSADPAADLLAI